jgi:hypothetical protein
MAGPDELANYNTREAMQPKVPERIFRIAHESWLGQEAGVPRKSTGHMMCGLQG